MREGVWGIILGVWGWVGMSGVGGGGVRVGALFANARFKQLCKLGVYFWNLISVGTRNDCLSIVL